MYLNVEICLNVHGPRLQVCRLRQQQSHFSHIARLVNVAETE